MLVYLFLPVAVSNYLFACPESQLKVSEETLEQHKQKITQLEQSLHNVRAQLVKQESAKSEGEERAAKIKVLLVKTKKELADSKNVVLEREKDIKDLQAQARSCIMFSFFVCFLFCIRYLVSLYFPLFLETHGLLTILLFHFFLFKNTLH